ncbi:MAG: hypothetical protein HY910_06615 [Desulfarculus sp.]|nr:hypothetical protein [Desulfarculus sp.]
MNSYLAARWPGRALGLVMILASLVLSGCPAMETAMEQEKAEARRQAEYATAVPVEDRGRTYWVIMHTLEPLAGGGGTVHALYFFAAHPGTYATHTNAYDQSIGLWLFPPPAGSPRQYLALDDRLYEPPEVETHDSRLVSIRLRPCEPTALMILEGITLNPNTKADIVQITQRNNLVLLTWKTKDLPNLVKTAPTAELQDWQIKLEAALLRLDLNIKKVKDAQDEAARYLPRPGQDNQAPTQVSQTQVEQAHLFSQRKAIVMACLEMVKKALAQKR